MHEAGEDGGIWRLSKWARTKAQAPNELPIMPTLVTPQGSTAETVQDKAEALKARFFPKAEADLSDITETAFQEESFPLNPITIS